MSRFPQETHNLFWWRHDLWIMRDKWWWHSIWTGYLLAGLTVYSEWLLTNSRWIEPLKLNWLRTRNSSSKLLSSLLDKNQSKEKTKVRVQQTQGRFHRTLTGIGGTVRQSVLDSPPWTTWVTAWNADFPLMLVYLDKF